MGSAFNSRESEVPQPRRGQGRVLEENECNALLIKGIMIIIIYLNELAIPITPAGSEETNSKTASKKVFKCAVCVLRRSLLFTLPGVARPLKVRVEN